MIDCKGGNNMGNSNLVREADFFEKPVMLRFKRGKEIELKNIDGMIRIYAISTSSNQPNVADDGHVEFNKDKDILFAEIENITGDVRQDIEKTSKTEYADVSIGDKAFHKVKISVLY